MSRTVEDKRGNAKDISEVLRWRVLRIHEWSQWKEKVVRWRENKIKQKGIRVKVNSTELGKSTQTSSRTQMSGSCSHIRGRICAVKGDNMKNDRHQVQPDCQNSVQLILLSQIRGNFKRSIATCKSFQRNFIWKAGGSICKSSWRNRIGWIYEKEPRCKGSSF